LRAAFRSAAEPVRVNESEPFTPVLKLKPVADASMFVPRATDSVREFEPPPPAAPRKLMALPLLVERTSDPFGRSVPEGDATIAGALSAVPVKTTVVAPDRLSPPFESERDKESDPTCVAPGLWVRPFRAAFRLAMVPVPADEGEPLVPVVKLKPVVGPSLPCETDSESGSELLPAAASIPDIALVLPLEKTSEMFPVPGAVPDAVPVAVIGEAARALTVSDALVELDSASPGYARAEFTLATGLDAVPVAEALVPVVIPVPEPRAAEPKAAEPKAAEPKAAEPKATVPCETDCESESESVPAAESVKETAPPLPPERASDPPPVNVGEPDTLLAGALPGTLLAGGLKRATVSATLVEAESVSPGSATETDNESEPE